MIGFLSLVVLFIGIHTPKSVAAESAVPMRFGMDISTMTPQTDLGVKPDYATFWVGPWTLTSGWGGPDADIDRAVAAGVTPVIHYYYWGDDVSISCIENGCWSTLHQAQKNKTNWQKLAVDLAAHLNARAQGKPVVIILESEFNKGNAATYEAFDGYLAEKAAFFRANVTGAEVVLGFGNWNPDAWKVFDRAAAASTYVGLQGIRGSTRDAPARYDSLVQATLDGVKRLDDTFGKPIFITDFALSSYPEPDYLEPQAKVLQGLFDRLGEFKALGVQAIVYRSLYDSPNMNTANYYGMAERYWGFIHAYDRTHKPAAQVWIDSVKAEREPAPVPAPTTSATKSTTTAPAPATTSAPPTTTTPYPTTSSASKTTTPPPTTSSTPPKTTTTTTSAALAPGVGPARIWMQQAESMQYRPIGGREADTTASGGARWNLWSNGAVSNTFQVDATGPYQVRVWANGQAALNVWPTMTVDVDGNPLFATGVRPGGWRVFVGDVWLQPGTHKVTIGFTNDGWSSTEDRNLLLDRVGAVPIHRVEAEAFTTRSTGAQQADPTAYRGALWNLWDNGYVESKITAPTTGTHEVRIRAKGQLFDGIAPHMDIYVDGRRIGSADPGTDWSVVVARGSLAAGTHTLRLQFTNNASNASEDRNLLLDRVEVLPV